MTPVTGGNRMLISTWFACHIIANCICLNTFTYSTSWHMHMHATACTGTHTQTHVYWLCLGRRYLTGIHEIGIRPAHVACAQCAFIVAVACCCCCGLLLLLFRRCTPTQTLHSTLSNSLKRSLAIVHWKHFEWLLDVVWFLLLLLLLL